jgi:hypothetical protein
MCVVCVTLLENRFRAAHTHTMHALLLVLSCRCGRSPFTALIASETTSWQQTGIVQA